MDSKQEEILQELIDKNDVQDNTESIRNRKDSIKIRKDVSLIQNRKRKLKTNDVEFLKKDLHKECSFLRLYYPSIFNKLIENEINVQVLYKFLDELEKIENGKLNQHEASYNIGLLLKSMYIDKVVDNLSEKSSSKKKNIGYMEYKIQNM
jgi:hypothetical protein